MSDCLQSSRSLVVFQTLQSFHGYWSPLTFRPLCDRRPLSLDKAPAILGGVAKDVIAGGLDPRIQVSGSSFDLKWAGWGQRFMPVCSRFAPCGRFSSARRPASLLESSS